jgi:crotonobetainyl-CoA:carnitine CoA-transferase CaiB-like acyl-CoA transferase
VLAHHDPGPWRGQVVAGAEVWKVAREAGVTLARVDVNDLG